MKRRPGDVVSFHAHNIGEFGRCMAVEEFLGLKQFDALMMCDLDQEFPVDTLEKLREHNVDMVSGHYMQRKISTLHSNWWYTVDGGWPYLPYLYNEIPKSGVHRIASAGFGCALIKREPIEAVKKYLDHWEPNSNPFEIGKVPEEAVHFGTWGTDWRFFYYAQKLGFELWGDADVETPHNANIQVTRDIRDKFAPNPDKDARILNEKVFLASIRSNGMITLNAVIARKKAIEGVLNTKDWGDDQRGYDLLQGQLLECQMWIDALSAESPPPGFVERWYRNPQPALTDSPVKFPVFKTKEELDAALANPEKDIEGHSIEQLKEDRKIASRSGAMSAAETMNGRNPDAEEPARLRLKDYPPHNA